MNRFWWVAFVCFAAAGVIAIANVYIGNMWLHIVALWLVFPMVVWAILYFTDRATRLIAQVAPTRQK